METPSGTPGFAFRTSAGSAEILRAALAEIGAVITGRRTLTSPVPGVANIPSAVPVIVVSHSVPDG